MGHLSPDVRTLFEMTGGFLPKSVHGVPTYEALLLDDGEFIVLAERADGKELALKRYESVGWCTSWMLEEGDRRVPDFRTAWTSCSWRSEPRPRRSRRFTTSAPTFV
jgi:hypothetical protein